MNECGPLCHCRSRPCAAEVAESHRTSSAEKIPRQRRGSYEKPSLADSSPRLSKDQANLPGGFCLCFAISPTRPDGRASTVCWMLAENCSPASLCSLRPSSGASRLSGNSAFRALEPLGSEGGKDCLPQTAAPGPKFHLSMSEPCQ